MQIEVMTESMATCGVTQQAQNTGNSPPLSDAGHRQKMFERCKRVLENHLHALASALDVSVKAQVVNLMLDLQARMGLAYLFISHDMSVVERISHRFAVMYLGEFVEIGTREAIFGNPQHPYTKRLLAAVPIADPSHRRVKRPLSSDEIRGPIRPVEFEPPPRQYREVSPGHAVMSLGE